MGSLQIEHFLGGVSGRWVIRLHPANAAVWWSPSKLELFIYSIRSRTNPPIFTVVTAKMASESWSRFVMLRVAGTETWGSPVLKVEVTLLRIAQPEQWIVRPHPSELRECAQSKTFPNSCGSALSKFLSQGVARLGVHRHHRVTAIEQENWNRNRVEMTRAG